MMKEHLSILLLTTAVLVTTAKSPRGLKDPDRRKLKFMKKFGGESCCLGFAGGIAAHHQAIAKSCDDSPEFKYDEGLMKIRGSKHPELCLSASRSYIGLEECGGDGMHDPDCDPKYQMWSPIRIPGTQDFALLNLATGLNLDDATGNRATLEPCKDYFRLSESMCFVGLQDGFFE